jgi:hypothetical protein
VAGGSSYQVIDQTSWLVHFRAGSLTADPLDVAEHNNMNQGDEQSRIRVAARHAPHSRAALAALRTAQRKQLFLAAPGIAHVHRAAPRFRLARAHRVRARAVGAPGGRRWVSSWWPRALCRGSGAAPHAPRASSNRRLLLPGAVAGGRYAMLARLSRNHSPLLLVRSAPAAEPQGR